MRWRRRLSVFPAVAAAALGCQPGEGTVSRVQPIAGAATQLSARWEEVTPRQGNGPAGQLLVWHPERRRIVMVAAAGVWEWSGVRWTQLEATTVAPSELDVAVYYPPRNSIVAFGGSGERGHSDQTWEWNGTAWTNRTVMTAKPTARWATAMAWDDSRKRVVLFGGYDAPNFGYARAAVWEWDGQLWTEVPPANPNAPQPSQRAGHDMVWDEVRGKIVLFGARPIDVWEWDGRTWTQRAVAAAQSFNRWGYRAAYDSRRRVSLLVAGDTATSDPFALEWDGGAGTLVPLVSQSAGAGPPARCFPGTAYDLDRRRLVVHGGLECNSFRRLSDIWELRSDAVVGNDGGATDGPPPGPDAGADAAPGDVARDASSGPDVTPPSPAPDGGIADEDASTAPPRVRKGAYEGCACALGARPAGAGGALGAVAGALALSWRARRRRRAQG
jgi:hypothetical protein